MYKYINIPSVEDINLENIEYINVRSTEQIGLVSVEYIDTARRLY